MAIKQSRKLGAKLTPPLQPTNCERPPVAYIAIDEQGRSIVTVEGPVELEPDQRHTPENEAVTTIAKKAETRTRRRKRA